jgi:hypothetical protein
MAIISYILIPVRSFLPLSLSLAVSQCFSPTSSFCSSTIHPCFPRSFLRTLRLRDQNNLCYQDSSHISLQMTPNILPSGHLNLQRFNHIDFLMHDFSFQQFSSVALELTYPQVLSHYVGSILICLHVG